MKVYTRTGDRGMTSLLSGGRVAKNDIRVEAYGTVDELSSLLGLLSTEPLPDGVAKRLEAIQETLFSIGSALADPEGRYVDELPGWDAGPLEGWIDEMESELAPLTSFILPGGCRAAALAHLARTVCRRAERRVCSAEGEACGAPEEVLTYLNRLSDGLFVLARFINVRFAVAEPRWRPRDRGDGQG